MDQTITTLMFLTVGGNLQLTGSRMLDALLAKLQRQIATVFTLIVCPLYMAFSLSA